MLNAGCEFGCLVVGDNIDCTLGLVKFTPRDAGRPDIQDPDNLECLNV